VTFGPGHNKRSTQRSPAASHGRAGVRSLRRQAKDILQRRPSLGVLPVQAEQLRGSLDQARGGLSGASSLTTAELRLLPLVATHLTYSEIGKRPYVSQHMVKSQVLSIYRKLGVSSRSHTVQRTQELGLPTG
jgi:LuxR family maltose regulon positive regulatory protein